MKKRLLRCLLSLSLSLTNQPVSTEETQRSLSTDAHMYKNIYTQTSTFDSASPETEERTLQPRFGYFWYCPSCGYENCWYFFHSIAAAPVVAHARKHDRHHPVIYEVQVRAEKKN